MSNTQEQLDALKDIRNLMEKSTRFLSLSGLAGVFAGSFALIGAGFAWAYLQSKDGSLPYFDYARNANGEINLPFITFFLIDSLTVLVLSLTFSLYFSMRKARKNGEKMWTQAGRRLLINMAVPLLTGGIFCIMMVVNGSAGLVAPATLIFYGLALVNSSKYTYENVRFLGLTEIFLGLLASAFVNHGLLFWSLGFGVAHIIYGIGMYIAVDRKQLH